jgi:hypothetical protein
MRRATKSSVNSESEKETFVYNNIAEKKRHVGQEDVFSPTSINRILNSFK